MARWMQRVDDLTDAQRETLIRPDCQQVLSKSEMKSVMVNWLEPVMEEDLADGYVEALTSNQKTTLRTLLSMSRSALNALNADTLANRVSSGFPRTDLDAPIVNFARGLAIGMGDAAITVEQCPNPLIEIVYTDSFYREHNEEPPARSDASSQQRSDEQGNSVNTQQQKAVSPPPESEDTQQTENESPPQESVNTQQTEDESLPPESVNTQQTEDESPPPESEDIQQTENESPPQESVNHTANRGRKSATAKCQHTATEVK